MEFYIETPKPESPKQDYPYMARGTHGYSERLYFVISQNQAVNLQDGNLFSPSEHNLERLPDGTKFVIKSKKGG